MKFSCERAALLAVLAAAVRIVAGRTTIPILSNALIEAEGDAVTVTTTDLDRRVSARVPADVERAGATTLPAKILHDLVRAAPADARISVDEPEGGRATLRYGRSRQTLASLPAGDYPGANVGTTPIGFDIPGAILARQLARCLVSVSTEETRYYLNGVLFHAVDLTSDEGPMLRMVATDGHRMVCAGLALPEGAAGLSFTIVPREACQELQRLAAAAAGPVRCDFGERLVRFTFPGGLALTSKTIDGTFPDYGRVIPAGNDKGIAVSRGPLTAALERVALVRDGDSRTRAVRFTSAPEGSLTLTMSTPTNEAVETIDAETEHHFETGFNPNYMRELLGAVDGDLIEFAVADAGSPAIIRASGDRGTLCVLMPMMV